MLTLSPADSLDVIRNLAMAYLRGTSGGRPLHAGDTAPAVELTRGSSQSGNCDES